MLNLRAKKEQQAAKAAAAKAAGVAPLHRAPSIRTAMVVRDLDSLDLPRTVRLVHPNPAVPRDFYIIVSPDEGIWKDGRFKFVFNFPDDYPNKPPVLRCETMVLHPNLHPDGRCCLNILHDTEWSPALSIQAVIFGLLFLFYEPNASDPLNIPAAEEMKAGLEAFKQKVRRTFQGGVFDGLTYERQPINYS
ncbi:putative NEDD8-conjugating enzyme UBC12 [Paratrimastix pyriformis]|uniref:NEDD8-conjugating enzyme UBC12 n=1 Tax=Paratrimastix pyriformis TaxID=342808 RepID=A0ABQ8UCW9_9EUKA|nr:putative NEDD8-conjugating enzyme UBC12 [Paratrimastix pyriformis]